MSLEYLTSWNQYLVELCTSLLEHVGVGNAQNLPTLTPPRTPQKKKRKYNLVVDNCLHYIDVIIIIMHV